MASMRVLTVAVLLSTTLTATKALECHFKRINACSSVCGCCRLCLLLLVPAELCQGHLHPQLLTLTVILQAGAIACRHAMSISTGPYQPVVLLLRLDGYLLYCH
jgi:hypothetical protein